MSSQDLLIFDMDGVLVDVRESYRQTVIEAVKHFTGAEITNEQIQAVKNRGSANNDWDLTLELVRERGSQDSREEVIEVFQRIYLGENNDGLIARERWLPADGLLHRLARRYRLALFTGRERWEALYTLSKFSPDVILDPVVGMEDVQREKPDPEGLQKILAAAAPARAYYVGDAVDDCRAARAAEVPFVGVAAPANPLREDLEGLFQQGGAFAIIADVNELEQALP
ncbi:MAG: HAD-IA family hydrolase [Acidobacteria bacterium]|nr:HAD-IA family hydrolase [Acidobacteriota bacterium]